MPLPMAPKIVYGTTTLQLTQTQERWRYVDKTVGGSDESGALVRATFLIATAAQVRVKPVFMASEWVAVLTWIRWAQQGNRTFTYAFDGSVGPTFSDGTTNKYTVQLIEPAIGNEVAPDPHSFPDAFTLELLLRRVGTVLPFDVRMVR